MKAISLWQPWASLCFTGCKKFETRHWSTFYRGPLAIHAAKHREPVDALLDELCRDEFGQNWSTSLPRGAVIGTVRLDRCISTEAFDPDAVEQLCGNWSPGRYAWHFEDQKLFDAPIPAIGRQGFFEWDSPAGPAARSHAGLACTMNPFDREATRFILESARAFIAHEESERERLIRIRDEADTSIDVKADRIAVGRKVIEECEAELSGEVTKEAVE